MIIGLKNEEKILWSYKNYEEARLGVLTKFDSKEYRSWLKNLVHTKYKEDCNSTFFITSEMIKGDAADYLDILQMEEIPASEEENQEFKNTRMGWVQEYLNLLSFKYGKERVDFIPLASFRSHIEGPLKGYERAIVNSDKEEYKKQLLNEFKDLKKVEWLYSKEWGYIYNIDKEDCLLSLYKGLWSFWLFTGSLTESRDLLLVVEIPSKLNRITEDQIVKDYLTFMTKSINQLTFNITLSVIFVSENFFPLPEIQTSNFLFFKNSAEDFDWKLPENQFYPKDLKDEWLKDEHSSIALYTDALLTKSSLIDVNT